MMAIADIFEALTAADRPYKKAKSLSESIKIMSFMKKDQHQLVKANRVCGGFFAVTGMNHAIIGETLGEYRATFIWIGD
jgi:hypothetical protein